VCARTSLALSPGARCDERFHFEVMRRAAPELVALPFLDDTWAPAIAAGSPVEVASEPFRVERPPPAGTAGKRAVSGTHTGWPLLDHESRGIERLFKDARRRSDLDSMCDVRKLRRIAKSAPDLRKQAQIKELFSAVGVALTLLGAVETAIDEPAA
jgi:hypothetical protein